MDIISLRKVSIGPPRSSVKDAGKAVSPASSTRDQWVRRARAGRPGKGGAHGGQKVRGVDRLLDDLHPAEAGRLDPEILAQKRADQYDGRHTAGLVLSAQGRGHTPPQAGEKSEPAG